MSVCICMSQWVHVRRPESFTGLFSSAQLQAQMPLSTGQVLPFQISTPSRPTYAMQHAWTPWIPSASRLGLLLSPGSPPCLPAKNWPDRGRAFPDLDTRASLAAIYANDLARFWLDNSIICSAFILSKLDDKELQTNVIKTIYKAALFGGLPLNICDKVIMLLRASA